MKFINKMINKETIEKLNSNELDEFSTENDTENFFKQFDDSELFNSSNLSLGEVDNINYFKIEIDESIF